MIKAMPLTTPPTIAPTFISLLEAATELVMVEAAGVGVEETEVRLEVTGLGWKY